ncbi:MAG: HAMP domain-containing protein, partial [Gemmatimonadetes bacterium]|nr:HAMP domain-containing protein [Gemmatimonadota bacterium]
MLRSRFLWKLYAGYVALILLTSTLIGLSVARAIARDTIHDTEQMLFARAALLRDIATTSLTDPANDALQKRLPDLGVETGARLTVIHESGRVIADSEAEHAVMDNHGNRPEIMEARGGAPGKSTRFSETMQQRMMYLALPVYHDAELVGFVRASLPLNVVSERLTGIRNVVIATAAVAALAALIIGFLFARRVTRPLVTMTAAAQAIAGGDYRHALPVEAPDEIGRLAGAFDQMVGQLRSRMETIVLERNRVLAILGSMVEGVVAVDRHENILFINQVAADLFQADPAESLGKPIREVTQIPAVSETLRGSMDSDRDMVAEAKVGEDANWTLLEMRVSPLRDSERRLAGAVLVFHDLTQLRSLEA